MDHTVGGEQENLCKIRRIWVECELKQSFCENNVSADQRQEVPDDHLNWKFHNQEEVGGCLFLTFLLCTVLPWNSVRKNADNQIFITFFQEPNDCNFNFIQIFDGKTDIEHRQKEFCGSIAEPWTSESDVLYLRWLKMNSTSVSKCPRNV